MKTLSRITTGMDASMSGVDAMAREDYAEEACIVLIRDKASGEEEGD
jgi:hypothetical protein